jgi:MYXO-CTERM domain-containing protein
MPRAVLAVAAALVIASCVDGPDVATTTSAVVDPGAFTLPALDDAERAAIVGKYDALDPGDIVPRGLLEDAIVYYDVNQDLIPKHAYMVVIDLSLYSGKDRFWLVDLASGVVEPHKVAHGDGSDPDNDGYATLFGNVDGSHMSSLGFYLSGEIYDGTHPHSMRIDGLSADGSPNNMANTNVRDRLIVVHEASYVDDTNTSQQGRSNGCFALDPGIEADVVDRIHDGTLMYSATSPLNPPVGRGGAPGGSDGGDGMGPADQPGDPAADANGGCASGGGGNGPLVFVFLIVLLIALRRRR